MRIFADAFKEILNYMNDICCIGHITLDKIVTPKQTITCREALLTTFHTVYVD